MSRLTGCQVVNSSLNLQQFTENLFGYLTSIKIEKIRQKNYIHFQNTNASTQTFVACVPNEALTAEVQYLLRVAQSTFQRTISFGYAVCGGACFYTYCMCFVWKSLANQAKPAKQRLNLFSQMNAIKSIFFSFAKSLLDESDEWKLDLSSGHLFNIDDSVCNCGLFKTKQTMHSLIDPKDSVNFSSIDFRNVLTPNENLIRNSPQFIDCYGSKVNAFALAREILSSILHIGVFIHN